MPSLPKRPGPYLALLLLIIMGLLTYWMLRVLDDPAIQRAVQKAREEKATAPSQPGPPLPIPTATNSAPQAMDAGISSMHAEMLQADTPPEREVEILHELLAMHQRALGPGSFGDNGDVTQALVGTSASGVWLPRQSPRIREGQLLDRWGTAYWFHANDSQQIEIRSAGPDKVLFNSDDILLNPSPAGFGATPVER